MISVRSFTKTRAILFFLILLMLGMACDRLPMVKIPEEPKERLTAFITYLSSDELEGRGTGTAGNKKAAYYIRELFKSFGLQPLGNEYYQEFKVVTEVQLGEGNSLVTRTHGQEQSWEVGTDFMPMPFTENQSATGKVAFVGYGISAPDLNYDDYSGIDPEGKIVIIMRESPDYEDPHGKFSDYVSLSYKIRNAREHKVAGVLFVNPPSDTADELYTLKRVQGDMQAGVPAIHVKQSVVTSILPESQLFEALEEGIKSTMKPASFDIPDVEIEMNPSVKLIEKPTWNVVGIVPGNDPKLSKEYIIVGAHYDHLGWGQEGSRYTGEEPAIHHGADDNASGVAAMLEVAKHIGENPQPRSVVFIAFGAEEMGALGSAYYCKNPLVPLENTVLMLNLDMVGRLQENKLQVTGTGTSSAWDSLIDTLSNHHGLEVSKSADGYGPSDHASFYSQNVSVLNLFTGLHDDYHKPSDTVDKINFDGLLTIAQFARDIVVRVAHLEKRPDFVK
ncbi:MAG: M20/M25/M40 family metallo-hydrolase, partial [Calditrichaeota bacterium]